MDSFLPFPVRRFLQDRRGNVLILTGLALPVLVALAVGAMETQFATQAKSQMQTAADQAVIAALTTPYKKGERDGGRLRATKRADRIFSTNLHDQKFVKGRRGQLTLRVSGGKILARYDVEAQFDSSFGAVSPFEGAKLKITSNAELERGRMPRLTEDRQDGDSRIEY